MSRAYYVGFAAFWLVSAIVSAAMGRWPWLALEIGMLAYNVWKIREYDA